MTKLLLALLLAAPSVHAAGSGCQDTTGSNLPLEKIRSGAVGSEIIGCINRSFETLSSTGASMNASTASAANLGTIYVNRIGGRSVGTAQIRISSAIYTDPGTYLMHNGSAAIAGTLYTTSSTPRVGVNISSPVYDLDVNGKSVFRDQFVAQSSGSVLGNAFSVGTSTFVVAGGRVGIGTTSPQTVFHSSSAVSGEARIESNALAPGLSFYRYADSNSRNWAWVNSNTTEGALELWYGSSAGGAPTSGTRLWAITNGGVGVWLGSLFGLGGIIPSYTLDVNGFSQFRSSANVQGTMAAGQFPVGTAAPANFYSSDTVKPAFGAEPITAAQRNAISGPSSGTLVFTTGSQWSYWSPQDNSWVTISTADTTGAGAVTACTARASVLTISSQTTTSTTHVAISATTTTFTFANASKYMVVFNGHGQVDTTTSGSSFQIDGSHPAGLTTTTDVGSTGSGANHRSPLSFVYKSTNTIAAGFHSAVATFRTPSGTSLAVGTGLTQVLGFHVFECP